MDPVRHNRELRRKRSFASTKTETSSNSSTIMRVPAVTKVTIDLGESEDEECFVVPARTTHAQPADSSKRSRRRETVNFLGRVGTALRSGATRSHAALSEPGLSLGDLHRSGHVSGTVNNGLPGNAASSRNTSTDATGNLDVLCSTLDLNLPRNAVDLTGHGGSNDCELISEFRANPKRQRKNTPLTPHISFALPFSGPSSTPTPASSLNLNPNIIPNPAFTMYAAPTPPATPASPPKPKQPSLMCVVCMDKMRESSVTTCGHVFCRKCIAESIKAQKKCPTCRKKLAPKDVQRIYLDSAFL